MALLGRAARSPHALAGRSMLGAAELSEAVIRPTVCAADLVCVPTGGARASIGLCTSLDTYASIAATATMTLSHPDAARADLQLTRGSFRSAASPPAASATRRFLRIRRATASPWTITPFRAARARACAPWA